MSLNADHSFYTFSVSQSRDWDWNSKVTHLQKVSQIERLR